MKKVGYVLWFDDSSGEGEIMCPADKCSYYVHYSAIQQVNQSAHKSLRKYCPVRFSLYVNLYMKQVDKVEELSFIPDTKQEHEICQLLNDAYENGDDVVFEISERYYVGLPEYST